MPSTHNDYVLSTALASGWITEEQLGAVMTGLAAAPGVSALHFLADQQLITADQATALQHAIAKSHTIASEFDSGADEQPAATPVGHIHIEEHALHDLHDLPEGFKHVNGILAFGIQAEASDVHLGVSSQPLMRRYGGLQPMWAGAPVLTAAHTETLIRGFLTPQQWHQFQVNRSLEFSYEIPQVGRFRTSIIQQRKGLDAVFRIVSTTVKTMDELGLPPNLKTLTQYHNGLVLITGPVGSGKSTTMAAMVQEINRERRDHIITLEDPIEYLFTPAGCQVTQREVHSHTHSFANALRASLREDPDVIMVGEMRDLETISLAITASETGHLVLGTLHTSNASRTLDRILDAFPVEQQSQIRTMVSESLRGIVSQQLVPRADGHGRALALEILVNTPAVANLIRESKTFMLPGVIQTGKKQGMRLMDDSLMELATNHVISGEEAFDLAEQKKPFEKFLKH
jgi:twitching motility protein PilT